MASAKVATIQIIVLIGIARLPEIDLQIAVGFQVAPIGTPWRKIVGTYTHRCARCAMGAAGAVDVFARASEAALNQLVINSARVRMMRIGIDIYRLAIIQIAAVVY